MIGIIGAMDVEIESIESVMTDKQECEISGIKFVRGLLEGKDAVCAVCGMGKVAAAVCAQAMIMKYSPECVINTGVAGSLNPEVSVCDAVIADSLVQHDLDTTPLGDELGFIDSIGRVVIPSDKKVSDALEDAAKKAGIKKVLRGRIASGDQFVASKERKDYIVNNFGADACEMEGAAVAQVCFGAGVPFGVLRVMSDAADGSADMSYADFKPIAARVAADTIKGFVKAF